MNGLSSASAIAPRSRPPKRLRTLLDQCANFICLISQEVAGAVALNDLITIASSYVWYEEKIKGRSFSQEDIYQAFQSFLYNVNLPFRGGNSPFTNITLEFGKPAEWLRDEFVVIDGQPLPYKYADIPSEYYHRTALGFCRLCGRETRTKDHGPFPLSPFK